MEECIICLENLDTNIAILKCNHKFHYNCIQSWILNKQNYINFCPICDRENEIINIISTQNNNLLSNQEIPRAIETINATNQEIPRAIETINPTNQEIPRAIETINPTNHEMNDGKLNQRMTNRHLQLNIKHEKKCTIL